MSPPEPSAATPASPRLTLVVIARDEAAQNGTCLESARALVDAMIVLDTGSRDKTVAIAKAAGAKVYPFEWGDDFAAARNAALAQSRTPWNLILDADERLAEGAERLRAEVAKPADFIGVLPVVSDFDLAGQVETSTAWIPRLLPAGVRYQGRVHEQPVSEWPSVRLPVLIHHSGYRRSALARKQGRNRRLLLAMLAERPEDAYLRDQLGKDCEVYEDFEEAARQYQRALQASALLPRQPAYRHDLVVRALFALKRAGALEQAIALAEQEMPHWPQSPDFFFALSDLLLDWAIRHPEQAAQEILPVVEQARLKSLEIGEQPSLEGSVRGRGSFLAAHNLAVLNKQLGRLDEAEDYRGRAQTLRSQPKNDKIKV
ncbi:glycosyltransferase [Halochromatium roseum]|uniref:glycosyltransferase n=1 Tax=Halochromatium roseum TaxID=391920 RepID=UPI0019144EDD|nr:glycosyltransferase [Halochromatium roseum]MBK5938152.1 hypothetical protein [Halochromatium roseum]